MLSDQHGELILPIVHGARADAGMPPLPLPDADVEAVAEYIHSVVATQRSGRAAGERRAAAERARRRRHGGRGLLRGEVQQLPFADRRSAGHRQPESPRQGAAEHWVAGGGGGGARRTRRRRRPGQRAGSARGHRDGDAAHGEKVQGPVVRIDNFLVTLLLDDGTPADDPPRTATRPKVEVKDPLDRPQGAARRS